MCNTMLSLRKFYTHGYLDNDVTRNAKYNDACMLCQFANNRNLQFDFY